MHLAHFIFELLAYSVGFQLYLHLKKQPPNMNLIVGCLLGALLGSRLLAWFNAPLETWAALKTEPQAFALMGGKTIVGGILGGWLFIEWVKKRNHITTSTGDLFVLPLVVGIAIGRIGCFLEGLKDETYGIPTSLPWGVDFGDGLSRHPTQIYEIIFLIFLGFFLIQFQKRPHRNGALFRLFILCYFGFRFLIEFIKPRYALLTGLSLIQLACLGGVIYSLHYFLKQKSHG